MPNGENSGILVYAQLTRDNYIHTVFFEFLNKAKEMAQKLGGVEVNAVIFRNPDEIEGSHNAFANMGINKVYYFDDARLKSYSTEYYSTLLANLVRQIKPEIFLIGATNEGRDLAPRVSSELHTGLTADCIDLDINSNGLLAATRPTFGGELMATILCKNYPQMATVRPGVFKVENVNNYFDTEFIQMPVTPIEGKVNHVEIIDFKKTLDTVINDLDNAKIIVAGGMGLKNKAGFALLERFAKELGASVGATRAAVEAGLAPQAIQIGQTGKTVHPKLYIACGISGAIQHTVGMDKSDYIISINTDAKAPIFDISDTGIVGDCISIMENYLS